ncbi:AAA family ATPase [Corallococcus macrosporus]|uniref:ATPase AAA-type core domain-containing protein n=1 Tax=Corallococcus macrosporus DSM 14697 TaxID=1189310 RepID=A0A250JWJ3_9BACT|nr:AAA family ATPase [Corallococcus macrosporus]ATB48224.1 hypothetical protein MYMAC_003850 [Corallococcus macrosporus DSM 14697]
MFTEIEFPEDLTNKIGLKPWRLKNLKSTVVLAGPNGAGKSRYLKLIEPIIERSRLAKEGLEKLHKHAAISSQVTGQDIEAIKNSPDWIKAARKHSKDINLIHPADAPDPSPVILLRYPTPKEFDFKHESQFKSLLHRLEKGQWNPMNKTPAEINSLAASNTQGGFYTAQESAPAYLYTVARAIHEAEHPRAKSAPGAQKRLADAELFNRVLHALLGAEIESIPDDELQAIPTFRGRPLDVRELSAGEQVLMFWAIIIHRQRDWLQNAQILIDEPENHLHPDVCIRAINALREEALGHGSRIWLATHSLPLIAHAGIESVHIVDNGAIESSSGKINQMVDRLLGGNDGRIKLQRLLADADTMAIDSFAAQCLLPPEAISARDGDPQQHQMWQAAQRFASEDGHIRILDYAAGRGRLAAALSERNCGTHAFTYYAYQSPAYSSSDDEKECANHIQQLNQPGDPNAYIVKSLSGLNIAGTNSMNVVLMCNVLHEIPTRDWIRVFKSIHDVLTPNGRVVILEDQLPSVGELPHDNGYVILHGAALMELFGSPDAVEVLPSERDGRLTAFCIHRPSLVNVTPHTVTRALKKVRDHAQEQLRLIRTQHLASRTFQEGRRHAHFAMLYANADLALEEYPPDANSTR